MTTAHPAALGKVCVLVPTYNERETLPALLHALHAQVDAVDLDVLVIDDDSPDGTGELAEQVAARDPAVRVLHRSGKHGLGRAYLAGFAWARAQGYDTVVQMDADGSHQPVELPSLLRAARDADVVIGSRWVPGGSVRNWPWHRRALSVGGNLYTRLLLGIPVRDSTAGFRVYRMTALAVMGLEDVASQGYCFQVDLTLRAIDSGLCVTEVPIEFVEREVGASKMGGDIVREALLRVTWWGVQRRRRQVTDRLTREVSWHRATE
ncbi:MAG: polyprenol monophosphomannose synthase [Ornithinimicrobium sp.]|uniref:polyprenol monophosphomannose synthase n=1 Tax=Ornithinimicrobium sp. TaxID=1977084 RepID=UPI003D9B8556